jgi:hypothetical protein
VAFENTRCLSCGSALGYSVTAGRVGALLDVDGAPGFRPAPGAPVERRCANEVVAACTWVVPEDVPSGLCLSCRLTRTRPNDDDTRALEAFLKTEAAKRRLVYQLLDLRLPVVPWMDGGDLAFDLLSSRDVPVTTGHADGVITLDLAEGDDSHREAVRADLGEPYRTLLGHLRPEIGYSYWQRLTGEPPAVGAFRALFGDERAGYGQAVERHYAEGPPVGWGERCVSAYATMHPGRTGRRRSRTTSTCATSSRRHGPTGSRCTAGRWTTSTTLRRVARASRSWSRSGSR